MRPPTEVSTKAFELDGRLFFVVIIVIIVVREGDERKERYQQQYQRDKEHSVCDETSGPSPRSGSY
jgi:hypothetical protein